jgi:hypothetical protein
MKNVTEAIAGWSIWKLSGGRAYLILIGVWFILSWIVGPMSDLVYGLSILVSFFGPTVLFCFIFVRHWFLRADSSVREARTRRIGCIVASGVTLWLAIETALSYAHMDDAPRGLVWDLNMVIAPVLGGGVFLLTRVVVQRSASWTHSA